MRHFRFQALRAQARRNGLQEVVGPPLPTARFGVSAFRIRHKRNLSLADEAGASGSCFPEPLPDRAAPEHPLGSLLIHSIAEILKHGQPGILRLILA